MPLLDNVARGASFIGRTFVKRRNRRGVLSPKRGNKDYYKGKGGHKPGVHTKKGGYRVLPHKRIEYEVPDLTGFTLKPYVASDVTLVPAEERVPAFIGRSMPSARRRAGDAEPLVE